MSNADLERLIATTDVPEDAPLTATFSCTRPVAEELNAALRELKRTRTKLKNLNAKYVPTAVRREGRG